MKLYRHLCTGFCVKITQFLWDKYLGLQLLAYMRVAWFFFNCQIVFWSGCPILHSHQWSSFSASLLPFGVVIFFVSVILIGVHWYLIMVLILICISLVTNFMCLFVYHLWRNVCLDPLPSFWLGFHFSGIDLDELLVYFWN